MHPIVKNVIGFLAGLVIGSLANYTCLSVFGSIIGVPEGVDPQDIESIKANMDLYEWRHFMTPFIAHAAGSLVGAFVCTKIAAKYELGLSMGIALLFLFGGIAMVTMLPSPMWFNILDLTVSYFPAAYLGWMLARK